MELPGVAGGPHSQEVPKLPLKWRLVTNQVDAQVKRRNDRSTPVNSLLRPHPLNPHRHNVDIRRP